MKAILTIIIFCAAGVGIFFLYTMSQNTQLLTTPLATQPIQIGNAKLVVEIANTEGLRTQGLSGRSSLQEGSGMLFVFEEEGEWGIWMKDMQFPIDIIFAGPDGVVGMIYHTVSPETYPEVFYPNQPARYVLEVPAGYAKKAGIVEGARIVL